MKQITIALSIALTVATMASPARSLVVSAAKGQSAEQQSKDEAECHTLAVEQSGFDPEKAPTTVASPQQGRPRARGAARGAAVGAVGGAIAGDAGTGAAAGAAMGTMAGGMKKRDQARQQKAQIQQAGTAQASYNKALEACLEGRGYNVK